MKKLLVVILLVASLSIHAMEQDSSEGSPSPQERQAQLQENKNSKKRKSTRQTRGKAKKGTQERKEFRTSDIKNIMYSMQDENNPANIIPYAHSLFENLSFMEPTEQKLYKKILKEKLEDDERSLQNVFYSNVADHVVSKYIGKKPQEEDSVIERVFNYFKAVDKEAVDTIETLVAEDLERKGYKEIKDSQVIVVEKK